MGTGLDDKCNRDVATIDFAVRYTLADAVSSLHPGWRAVVLDFGSSAKSLLRVLENTDKDVILAADSWDPVLAVSDTLADSVESPQWAFPNDTEDVAIADPQFSAQHGNIHYLVMKRHVVQVRFPAVADAHPKDLVGLLVQLRDAANKEMPYAYRLDAHDREYVLVPTKTRNRRVNWKTCSHCLIAM